MDDETMRWDDHRAKLGEKGADNQVEARHAALHRLRPINQDPGYMNRPIVRSVGKKVR